jgi:hypothetical protein
MRGEGHLVELQQRALAVGQGQGGAFFDQVAREAVYAALGKLRWSAIFTPTRELCAWRGCTHFFAARLARVLVAVTGIFELGAALEVFKDKLIGSATHDSFGCAVLGWRQVVMLADGSGRERGEG